MWTAVVAGAGPAGAVAAIVLARSGHRPLLVDRSADGPAKIGEALPEAGGRLLRSLGLAVLDAEGAHAPIGGTLTCWGSDELVALDSFRHPAGQGWRLDRTRFDADLRAAAVSAGAIWREDRVREMRREGGGWEVELESGAVERAPWIVDATGRSALLARRLAVPRLRDPALVAFYARGQPNPDLQLNRTVVEAVEQGWWYAARLPSGVPIAGFHTDAARAAELRADPEGWAQELSRTRHVARLLAGSQFDEPPRAVDARGARLERFSGEGWIACGDAAICFDPISGQGIFSALHGGLAAGTAIAAALEGRMDKLEAYSASMAEVGDIYRARWRSLYRSERRWPAARFWTMAE
jgi:flavin-dependent dehydrogenase